MPKFSDRLQAKEDEYAEMPFSRLLGLVAAPPKWTPGALPGVETLMNTTEFSSTTKTSAGPRSADSASAVASRDRDRVG